MLFNTRIFSSKIKKWITAKKYYQDIKGKNCVQTKNCTQVSKYY